MALKRLIDSPRMKLKLSSSPASAPQRQEAEQRIRELRPRTPDMAGWFDDEVAELRQSLEQAASRRGGGFAIPLKEAECLLLMQVRRAGCASWASRGGGSWFGVAPLGA